MRRIDDDALAFIERMDRHYDLDRLLADFHTLICKLGFRHLIMTGLPPPGRDVEPLVIANHWPAEWSARYRQMAYFRDDPISVASLTQNSMFGWRDIQKRSHGSRADQIASEARAIGLIDGLAIPVLSPRRSVISIAADRQLDVSPSEGALIEISARYLLAKAENILGIGQGRGHLTHREREVLKWCGAGKSAWEIGEILAISEGTVKAHRLSAIRKLGCVNTTQAVVTAMLIGEIQL